MAHRPDPNQLHDAANKISEANAADKTALDKDAEARNARAEAANKGAAADAALGAIAPLLPPAPPTPPVHTHVVSRDDGEDRRLASSNNWGPAALISGVLAVLALAAALLWLASRSNGTTDVFMSQISSLGSLLSKTDAKVDKVVATTERIEKTTNGLDAKLDRAIAAAGAASSTCNACCVACAPKKADKPAAKKKAALTTEPKAEAKAEAQVTVVQPPPAAKAEAKAQAQVTVVQPPPAAKAEAKAEVGCSKDCVPHEETKVTREEKRTDGRCMVQTNMGYRFEIRANASNGRLMAALVNPTSEKMVEGTKALYVGNLQASKNSQGYDCDGMQAQLYANWEAVRSAYELPSACKLTMASRS